MIEKKWVINRSWRNVTEWLGADWMILMKRSILLECQRWGRCLRIVAIRSTADLHCSRPTPETTWPAGHPPPKAGIDPTRWIHSRLKRLLTGGRWTNANRPPITDPAVPAWSEAGAGRIVPTTTGSAAVKVSSRSMRSWPLLQGRRKPNPAGVWTRSSSMIIRTTSTTLLLRHAILIGNISWNDPAGSLQDQSVNQIWPRCLQSYQDRVETLGFLRDLPHYRYWSLSIDR